MRSFVRRDSVVLRRGNTREPIEVTGDGAAKYLMNKRLTLTRLDLTV